MHLRRLTLLARAVFARRRADDDLHEELAFHIERETERQIADGLAPAEARTRALARFGSAAAAADDCRDARGTGFIDNLVRDVLYAGRSFRRAPLVAATIVATVGLGLGLVAAVFTMLNSILFRADAVRDPHQLFAVERQRPAGAEPAPFTRASYDALRRETSIFADAFAFGPDVDRWIDGRRLEGTPVTGNFFQVLGVGAARGRAFTPDDDETGGRQVLVLSHRAWTQHFASDPAVVSRTVLVNEVPSQIIGVMPESFRGLTVAAPDFWAPLSVVAPPPHGPNARGTPGEVRIVGRLKPEVSRGQALAELMAWDSRHTTGAHPDRSAAPIVLDPRQGTVPLSAETLVLFTPLFFAFGLILLIGCANVANLLLARAVVRQREIGIRLAIGASRRRIVRQLLTEGLLLALASAALAFGISRVVLAAVVSTVVSTFPPEMGHIRLAVPPADWRVVLFLVVSAMASTLFFALVPALHGTRLELVRAVRGEVVRDARPGRARSALVALQVTGSALLLICSAIFLRSAMASARVEPGIRTGDIVMTSVLNEQLRRTLLDTVRSEPSVVSIAASWPGGLGGRNAFAHATAATSPVTYQLVSRDYFAVLGIDIVRGRGFTGAERNPGAAVTIVSESVARQLWPGADPIGQIMRLEPDPKSQTGASQVPPPAPGSAVVIGVARDVPGLRLGGTRLAGAGVYMPIDVDAPGTSLTTRVHGDPERARRALADRLAAIDPNMGEVITLRTLASMEGFVLAIPFWLTLALGALALALTLSGLFSVLSYLVEQRSREIGVRMALGATSLDIGRLVLSQSARPVALGLCIGGSLTAALGGALLATPAAGLIGPAVRLFDPIAYGGSALCIVGACACAGLIPAFRAGRIDPVAALRQD